MIFLLACKYEDMNNAMMNRILVVDIYSSVSGFTVEVDRLFKTVFLQVCFGYELSTG